MKEIPGKRLVLVGGVLGLACLFAAAGKSGGSASTPDAPAKEESGGFGISFGGDGKRVEVLKPRRGPIAATIQGAGTVNAGSEVGIGAPFEGRVSLLNKDDGDSVAKDELVFALDPQTKQEAVTEAEIDAQRKDAALSDTKIELEEARRKRVEIDDEPSDVTEARLKEKQSQLSHERADAQLEAAEGKLKRAKLLLSQGVGRETEVEATQSEHRVSAISLRIAKEELSFFQETLGFRTRSWKTARADATKVLSLAESGHTRAKADQKAARIVLARAKRDLKRTEIRSPIDGIITARQVNMGDEVSRATGDVAHYIISDLQRLLIYVDVDEGDVVQVASGQPAKVTVNALGDDLELTGAVYDIGYRARTKAGEDVPFFRVRVLLKPDQPGHDKLRPGMTATVEVETAREAKALKVPIQAVVQRERDELPGDLDPVIPKALREGLPEEVFAKTYKEDLLDVVYVVKDGRVHPRIIKLGIQDPAEVQILAGLEDDLPVVVGPYRLLEKLRNGTQVETTKAKNALPAEDIAPVESGS